MKMEFLSHCIVFIDKYCKLSDVITSNINLCIVSNCFCGVYVVRKEKNNTIID